jgi:hypothetical protein
MVDGTKVGRRESGKRSTEQGLVLAADVARRAPSLNVFRACGEKPWGHGYDVPLDLDNVLAFVESFWPDRDQTATARS